MPYLPYLLGGLLLVLILLLLPRLLGVVYIPHTLVGIIEKRWSKRGNLREGRIIARAGEAGFQTTLLRGGLQWRFWPWQYRVHKHSLVAIGEGKIGYVYARDGLPLDASQTLGKVVDCNHFQDAEKFLQAGGQRGRQRGILREGVYAINTALFVVIAEDTVYSGPVRDQTDYREWQAELARINGFRPVRIGAGGERAQGPGPATESGAVQPRVSSEGAITFHPDLDTIGVVTVQDGPTIESGQIIAPEVKPALGADGAMVDHNYFQNPEAFLALGGRRGKQLQVLTDGTFFINHWFATLEVKPKTLIQIGYVDVVVSYYGGTGSDTTGAAFRYGEQVEEGNRGVWKRALAPGKYALNPYAVEVELVPTINFVLRWISGVTEAHHYDEGLTSIDLITADGYEPRLPLSLVLHIDYQKAPSVVQRFGDVKRLITQTLDPILTAYFRDVAQTSHMLELLTKREEIQKHATEELGRRFREYDINCVAVLIGRPESRQSDAGNDPIERLFDQLRMRRLAAEQQETFNAQRETAEKERELNESRAKAAQQENLTRTKIGIEIAINNADAEVAQAERQAKKAIALAEGEASAAEEMQLGMAQAAVLLQKVTAYRDPRIFALSNIVPELAKSEQPLVPERLVITGNGGHGDGAGMGGGSVFESLMAIILSDKLGGTEAADAGNTDALRKFADDFVQRAEPRTAEAVRNG